MIVAVASLRCEHAIEINGVDNVKTSFPNFVELANSIGMNIVGTKANSKPLSHIYMTAHLPGLVQALKVLQIS
jgi:hypothetical protein